MSRNPSNPICGPPRRGSFVCLLVLVTVVALTPGLVAQWVEFDDQTIQRSSASLVLFADEPDVHEREFQLEWLVDVYHRVVDQNTDTVILDDVAVFHQGVTSNRVAGAVPKVERREVLSSRDLGPLGCKEFEAAILSERQTASG